MGSQEKKDKTPDPGPDSLIMEMLTPNQINFLKESLAQVETAKTTTASGNYSEARRGLPDGKNVITRFVHDLKT